MKAGACLMACSLLAVGTTARADETEVSFAYMPAPAAETVVIEQPLGRLSLHGWDRPEVRVVAHKHARTSATLDRLRVHVEMNGGHIQIRTGVRIGGSFRELPIEGAGIDLTIDAPRQAALKASTWAGDLEASGFRAGAELSSSGGEVRATDIDGPVRSSALKGRQRLASIHGDVEADGVDGDLELDSVDGNTLDAKVVEGQITARQVRTPVVRLLSTAGGIVFVGTLRAGGRYELWAGEGNVRMVLARVPFTLDARAPAGQIHSQFALPGAERPNQVEGEFMGGGPQLVLTAAHGDVDLERSR